MIWLLFAKENNLLTHDYIREKKLCIPFWLFYGNVYLVTYFLKAGRLTMCLLDYALCTSYNKFSSFFIVFVA